MSNTDEMLQQRIEEKQLVRELGERIGYGNTIELSLDLWDELMEQKYGIKGHRSAHIQAMAAVDRGDV